MKLHKIIYNVVEMLLFVGASLFVTNNYINDSSPLNMAFGLFLLLIFINQVIKSAKKDAQEKNEGGDE